MSYKLSLPRVAGQDWGRGEFWRGESFEEHLRLCDDESVGRVFEQLLPRPGKILDAGCGLGRWVVWLRQKSFDVVGLDLSAEALRELGRHASGLPLIVANGTAIPARDATFDAVLSMGVVEHAEEGPETGLRELRRVMKAGGLLFLSVPFNNPFRRYVFNHVLRAAERLFRHRARAMQFAEYRFDCGEVERLLRGAGFEPLQFAVDEFAPPRSVGLWIDLAPLLGVAGRSFELNRAGRAVRAVSDSLSPWLTAGGVLCVGRAV